MLKSTLRHTAVYMVPMVLSRGINFLLLPVYTRFLSKADLGVVELLLVFQLLASIVLSLELPQALARFVPGADAARRRAFASVAFCFVVATSLVAAALMVLFAPAMSLRLFGSLDYVGLLRLWGLSLVALSAFQVAESQYRFTFQSARSAALNLTFAAISGSVSCVMLLRGDGLIAMVAGPLAGAVVGAAMGLVGMRRISLVRWPQDWSRLGEMLGYSAPLVFSSVAVYLCTTLDRWMIGALLGLDELGAYGVAMRFAGLCQLFLIAFRTALVPLIYRHYEEPDTPRKIGLLLMGYVALGASFVVAMGAVGSELVSVVAGQTFQVSGTLMAVMSASVLALNAYLFFPGLDIAKRTGVIALLNILAAMVNVVMNLYLIPRYGALGAASATLCGGVCMATLYRLGGRRSYRVTWGWVPGLVVLAAGGLVVAFHVSTVSLSVRVLLAALFGVGACVWVLREGGARLRGMTEEARVAVLSLHPLYDTRVGNHLYSLQRVAKDIVYVNWSDAPRDMFPRELSAVRLVHRSADPAFGLSLRRYAQMLWWFFRHLFVLQPELVHIHDLLLLPLVWPLRLTGKARIVFDVHEHYTRMPGAMGWFARFCTRAFLPCVHGLVGVTSSTLPPTSRPTTIVPNYQRRPADGGLSGEERVPRFADHRVRMVYFGCFSPEDRDIPLLLALPRRLLPAFPELHIDYGGRLAGDQRDRIEAELKQLELQFPRRFTWHGLMRREDVLRESAGADVGLLLCHADLDNVVGSSPNKIYEYLQAGAAIVASDGFEDANALRDSAALLFPRGVSADTLCVALAALLRDPERLARMKAASREWGRTFSWDQVAPRYLDLYRDIGVGL